VRPAGRPAEIKVGPDELAQAEMLGQCGGQQELRVGHQMVIVEGRVEAVEAVR
jgi:hypothetical protein